MPSIARVASMPRQVEALREADQWRMDNEAAWQARAAQILITIIVTIISREAFGDERRFTSVNVY